MLLASQFTPLCPDAIKFRNSTADDPVFGTSFYQLDAETGIHSGGFGFWEFREGSIHCKKIMAGKAIFDFEWVGPEDILAATVDRSVELWGVGSQELNLKMQMKTAKKPLMLSTTPQHIWAGCEEGHLAKIDREFGTVLSDKPLHIENVWCIDKHPTQSLLATGSDDTYFKVLETEHLGEIAKIKPAKDFCESGVTSVKFGAFGNPDWLAIGNFLNRIYLYDIRQLTFPVAKVEIEGCAWRQVYFGDKLLVGLGSGNGWEVWQKAEDSSFERIKQQKDVHKSLVYGVDTKQFGDTQVIASCSFYDKLVAFSH